jgi:hypothetical protein
MRRLSLTATLASVFTLITLLTFYFVGSYLYTNLRVQLLRIDSEEVVIKAQHLRALVAGEDSAQDMRTHISRFAGTSGGKQRLCRADPHQRRSPTGEFQSRRITGGGDRTHSGPGTCSGR